MNRDHSVVFEIASKYCMSDSFVDCDGYSISSEGFLHIHFILIKSRPSRISLFKCIILDLVWKILHESNIPVCPPVKQEVQADLRNITDLAPYHFRKATTIRKQVTQIFCFSTSYTGEGNDIPLQYSCLENPRAKGAWWAAVHGVAESDTTEET